MLQQQADTAPDKHLHATQHPLQRTSLHLRYSKKGLSVQPKIGSARMLQQQADTAPDKHLHTTQHPLQRTSLHLRYSKKKDSLSIQQTSS